jgi:hypothetical protein
MKWYTGRGLELTPVDAGLTRRRLMACGGAGLLGLSGALRVLHALAEAELANAQAPPLSDQEVRATIAAYADTIVPGPAGGADSAPGAIEAGVLDELYDPFYGASGAYPGIAADLQTATPLILGRPAKFELALDYADRERVVRDRILEGPAGGTNPLAVGYQAVAVLVYLSYYGTPQSELGPRTIGFPPHSDGYFPRHSHHVRFKRMTRNGNPR